jgi:hypothetical protein
MACLTRCVSSWETKRCEDRPFAVFLIHDSSPLERTPEQHRTLVGRLALHAVIRITCLQSQLEAGLLFCPVSFGGDPEFNVFVRLESSPCPAHSSS